MTAHSMNITTLAAQQCNATFDRTPDQCPVCHRSVQPTLLAARGRLPPAPQSAELVYQCTSLTCQAVFIARYNLVGRSAGHYAGAFLSSVPATPMPEVFPSEILALSPNFVLVYNQAKEAETRLLDQISGMGFRKALEFLIKDYCKVERPNDATAIEATLLGTCINNYVSDVHIKECAKRAAWLGNDETHYIRKWTTKDINDLKMLVKLTVNWIHSVTLTRQYIESMPS